jgi:hypothetical protein
MGRPILPDCPASLVERLPAREEFFRIDDATYPAERGAVLRVFLERPTAYAT